MCIDIQALSVLGEFSFLGISYNNIGKLLFLTYLKLTIQITLSNHKKYKLMAHYYLLPNGDTADNMKAARTILGIGTHKFRKFVKMGIVNKVEGKLNNVQNVEPLIARSDEILYPQNR